ncbi:MAG: Ig-like domain-containing protein [Clostridiales bacterium]|nr:Ig-like domain-containing protein [Clostridiales bacterium]
MKSRKIISALTAIAMSVASWQCFSVFAEGETPAGKEILKYTFDREEEEKVTRNYSEENFNGSLTFSRYDGQTEPFLYTSDSSWASGYFSYDTKTTDGGRLPKANEMWIQDSKLNVNLQKTSYMRVRIPTTPGTGEQEYKIEFTMTQTGVGQYLRLGVDGTPEPGEDNNITTARKGGMVANFENGPVTYSKIVSLSSDVKHYLAFVLPTDGTLEFSIDELTVTQVSSQAFVSKTVPAKDAENVTTYAYPKVYFAKPIDTSTASNIKLKDENGNEVGTTNNVDSDGMIVTLKTKVPLNGNKKYTIDVPDTVEGEDGLAVMPYKSTFKTAYENVVVSYDFEKEGNQGDNGMMLQATPWESTLSLTEFSRHSSVLKIVASQPGGNAKLYVRDKDINNDYIEGDNIDRTYLIEFDLYIPSGSGASITFVPTFGDNQSLVSDAKNTDKWMHVWRKATFTKCWNPYVEITNNVAAGPIYIDNFKVVDISKKAAVTMTKADNGKVSATAENIQNTHGSDATFWLIQAVYCGDKLVEAVKVPITVGAADTSYKTLNSKIDMPAGSDYSVKAFLWDMSTLDPLTKIN